VKQTVKLSPKLQLGVGRRVNRGNLLPYATLVILVISGVLAIRAGYMVIHRTPAVSPLEPQVLGAEDTAPTNQKLFKEYTVQKGDTVYSIGQKYGISWTTLATLNGLSAPFALQSGQIIKIPQQ
jgi:hypothetical protein